MAWDGTERRKIPTECQVQILDRVVTLEYQLKRFLDLRQEDLRERTEMHVENRLSFQKLEHALLGDGYDKPGMLVIVDRHDQQLRMVVWILGIVVMIGIGLIMTQVWDLIKR